MTQQESVRLNKASKEFNVGITTLVDFLRKKGFDIEASPHTKISAEAYAIAAKEFGKEQDLKEASKKIDLKVLKEKQEAVSIDNVPDQKKVADQEDEQEQEVFVKVNTAMPAPELKVVGKINLDDLKGKKEQPAAPVAKQPEPVVEVPVKSAPVQPDAPVEEVTQPVAATVKEEEPAATVEAPDKGGVKVVGKIDLASLNKPADKPKKLQKATPVALPSTEKAATPEAPKAEEKSVEAVKEVVVEKPQAPEVVAEEAVDVKKPSEFIPTKFEKLTGPNVVGKIDLGQFNKKPESAESIEDKNRKKRKRIKKDGKVNIAQEALQVKLANPAVSKDGAPKPTIILNKNNQAGGNKGKKREPFKPVRQEVNEEEVQKQVKDTLARLTAGKGKTKSSKYRRDKREAVSQRFSEEQERQEMESNILSITEFVTVNDLATMMDSPVTKVIEACMNLGLMVSINQRLDAEALVLVAEEFGYQVEFVSAEIQDAVRPEEDSEEDLLPRPPIVTVMGHVDHGKTSLLDYIRKANVIAGEAGGITQHIGAYNVELHDGKHITFLDTPGHEAFTAMRARGASVTDIAIIIVAADDSVMPQTVEAINHAMAAGVPMIFAINKIDKPGANSEKIKEQLANMNILVEDWGGKFQCQEISAKQGLNVDKLLEKVLLEADMLNLRANPNKRANGSIIESTLDKGRGYVATVLIQNGTLRMGDIMLSGTYTGRLKAMLNERGQKIESAGPSTPVLLLGLNGAPTAGELFNVMLDEREARDIANKREQLTRIQGLRTQKHITLEEIGRRIAIGNFKELNIIIKGDVDGSIEALTDSLIKLSNEQVQVNIIHKAVGAISESDVLLAVASNAIIIGFQVRPSASARRLAEKEEIEIRLYSVIYDAINEVKDGIQGMLAPEMKEEITSQVEVLEVFKITKVGTVAGCMVREGKITRHAKIRVIRDGIVVYTSTLGSLKRFKEDVKEVTNGYECGLNIDNFNDIKVGDMVESYEIVEVKRK